MSYNHEFSSFVYFSEQIVPSSLILTIQLEQTVNSHTSTLSVEKLLDRQRNNWQLKLNCGQLLLSTRNS
ncbi:hypothetical protein ACLKA7_011760 [Drosophila subpalustris]